MIRLILSVCVNALALWVAVWLLPGMELTSTAAVRPFGSPGLDDALAYLLLGLLFGAVNAVIRPLVALLSLPLTCLTLGLFTVIINAAMLALTAWLSSFLPVSLHLDSFFWTTVLAALVIMAVSLVMSLFTARADRPERRARAAR